MNLDNEETYFTRRQNGAIKDEDVEKEIIKLEEFNNYKQTFYGQQWFKVEVCAGNEMKNVIQIILKELKYREAE